MAKTRSQREPELLRAARNGHGKIVALFGGQGSHNAKCLDELRDLQTTQFESTSNLLQRAGYLLEELANAPHSSGFHDDYGFNLERWLAAPSSAPPKRHLALAPISFPLNTLLRPGHNPGNIAILLVLQYYWQSNNLRVVSNPTILGHQYY
jgi:fatty acid synthase subunit beta